MTANNYDEPCRHCAALVPKGTGLLVEVPLGGTYWSAAWWAFHHDCANQWRAGAVGIPGTMVTEVPCPDCGAHQHHWCFDVCNNCGDIDPRGWCTQHNGGTRAGATLAHAVRQRLAAKHAKGKP